MARCEGTTQSGARCKREARPGSRFCYIHDPEGEETEATEEETRSEELQFEDFVPLILAGLMTAGMVLLLKSLGKWIPR